MAELSPTPDTVLDAFLNGYTYDSKRSVAFQAERNGLAAALRAAADQLIPPVVFDRRYTTEERWDARDDIRHELLAIAAELEGTNDN